MRLNRKTIDHSGLSKLDRFRDYYAKRPDQFIEKYAFIRTKNPGAPIQLLKPKHGQRQVLEHFRKFNESDRPIRLVILKSRQVGISTLVAAYVFGQAYCQNNFEALVMAHEKDVTTNLFRTYRRYLESLPSELQLKLERSNKEELIWGVPYNTVIKVATAGTKQSTRSRTINWFHGSEAAFYKDLKTTKQAMEGSVPLLPGCGIVFESTAYGVGGDFHELWLEAGDPDSAYEQCFLQWFDDEDCKLTPWSNDREMAAYLEAAFAKKPQLKDRAEHFKLTPSQIAFYYETLKAKFSGDEILMATEYPCDPTEAFVATGSPTFPTYITQSYRVKTKDGTVYDPHVFTDLKNSKETFGLDRDKDAYIEIWIPPQEGREYLIACDSAAGLANSDPSHAYIIDIITQNIVGCIHGRIEISKFGKLCMKLGEIYHNALLVNENDGLGASLTNLFVDSGYSPIYQWRKLDGYGWRQTNLWGWETTAESRLTMIAHARRLFADRVDDPDNQFLPDKMLIHELGTFVEYNGKAQAAKGCHDDRVIAWCIGLAVALQELQCSPDLVALAEGAAKLRQMEAAPEPNTPYSIIQDFRNWGNARPDYDGPFQMEGSD